MRWFFLGLWAVLWLCVGTLLLVPTFAPAQAPQGGPTVDEQLRALTRLIDTQYERVVREKVLLATETPLVDPGAKVFRLTEQLRVTTRQCTNREDEALQLMRFKDGQIATAQLQQAEQATLIQDLRAQVASLEKAVKAPGQPQGPAPEQPGPAAESKTP